MRACAFDPNIIKPMIFDFTPHMVGKKDNEKGTAKATDKEKDNQTPHPSSEGQARQRLPPRLNLGAFSKPVGHRPMGLQVAQVKLFTQRFCQTSGTCPCRRWCIIAIRIAHCLAWQRPACRVHNCRR